MSTFLEHFPLDLVLPPGTKESDGIPQRDGDGLVAGNVGPPPLRSSTLPRTMRKVEV